ncbi:Uncharacterised protein [Vibrio cholerae]|uniref:Uncharacterized protein n=3 Tax=Vibrio cholerae TaxID=666 RepID=Q9KSL5_VIBCH|nr:hypothetical protein VC_1241 [Vibrio cholerae O1 biovar El Tor str. N16961]ACP05513.1 conserved hypothetical protein [Vibrio cholerae M66-2]ACP09368.1 conserved hypothetical protein [Vibrio cholerae O395]AET26350.1 conserved hypothetical protein [Vibrio cholerae O1 str. 2010EL-1786]KFE07298.1 hypothetical protein DN35_178 [Vibrio cholerae]
MMGDHSPPATPSRLGRVPLTTTDIEWVMISAIILA